MTRRMLLQAASVVIVTSWVLATVAGHARAEVRAWEGTLSVPTYPWKDDINPKFWTIEAGTKLSTTVKTSIIYPYSMQDDLSRVKGDRTYRAVFLENEYLKVTCLPELGGRLFSVLDKTKNEEMFHVNHVIKPGMIAMRGAWISGGVEWNFGPQGHTVTVISPVDVVTGTNPDGSAYLQISNQEKIFRTRWTVRVTLHPRRAYLDEQIGIENSTDGMHPYYFWNCTAFPNRPGTRFIYPMSLGTDHSAREFFTWPIHEGRDLTWLKNFPTYASVFAVDCHYGFFGAYDVDADRGIVNVVNHREVGGKKAWTWGEWDFGRVAEKNLTDDDGPYIEVQSGPLPTQSDYGMLAPHDRIAWQEWWYPVHGLGDGFEYATREVAAQSARSERGLALKLLATGRYPQAECVFSQDGRPLARKDVDLGPEEAKTVELPEKPTGPVEVAIVAHDGQVLAKFTTPLPIPKTEPPDPAKFVEKPDSELTAEQLCLKGRKFDRATDRLKARQYYEKARAVDPGLVAALRSLAVLDFEAALYRQAIGRLQRALDRDSDDGLSWFYLGACHLRLGDLQAALDAGYHAAHSTGTVAIGYDLAGRAHLRSGDAEAAITALEKAVRANNNDLTAAHHLMLAHYAAGNRRTALQLAKTQKADDPTDFLPRIVLSMGIESALATEMRAIRKMAGEADFELIEASLAFAELGLMQEAGQVLRVGCVETVPREERSPMAQYYLAWYCSRAGDEDAARTWLQRAAEANQPLEFASRPESLAVLEYAVGRNPGDAGAHLQLGNLLANLGQMERAEACWQKAAQLDAKRSVAWRNLALAAAARDDAAKAEEFYRKAIAARADDQTLYRDLAEVLIAADRRGDAIELLRGMPLKGTRRADVTILLAQAYLDAKRYDDALDVLESTPNFVNWEGQDITWQIFNQAHIARGRQRMEQKAHDKALADFEAALTYPANLNVGRKDKPKEAAAQYWRGMALAALGRMAEAHAAWKLGAEGADLSGEQHEYRERCRELR